MSRAASRIEARIQRGGRGLLPDLVSVLLLKRDERWRPFAVDDFVAVLILEYGMGWEGLDANAMGILRGFRERVELSRRLPHEEQQRLCAEYFTREPIPGDLLEQAAVVVQGLRERESTNLGGAGTASGETSESRSWVRLAVRAA